MGYQYSDLDRKNSEWFAKDDTRATLVSISVKTGKIRGLHDLKIDFTYPITAIAGRNCSGKTTILALAACAYHNSPRGYRLSGRKHSYYTFSDFFIQTKGEIPLEGISIRYLFLHNNWKTTTTYPDKAGLRWQGRHKKPGGRWNNYDRRISRTVIYLGFDRAVPHAEKSVFKSYRGLFSSAKPRGWEDDVHATVGRILGTDYSTFEYRQHLKYRLPVVGCRGTTYSGFNMGAGEDALFEIISTIMDCPKGALFLIDELELGLHEDAQARLIKELKVLCETRHIQIICTTHSPRILECLPPEGRIFLERVGESMQVIPGISTAYASGKLSGRPNVELDVLVEDEESKLLVEASLSGELRYRTDVLVIGSATAVIRQLAARYKEHRPPEVCVLLDGDQRGTKESQISCFLSSLEQSEELEEKKKWVEKRMGFLPGEVWPEAWVVGQRTEHTYERLQREFGISHEKVDEMLNAARRAGKHNEFFEAARLINCEENIVAYHLVKSALESAPEEAKQIVGFIQSLLDQ